MALLAKVTVVVEAVVLVVQSRPGDPLNISILSAAEVLHAPQSFSANDDAEWNMKRMSVTLDTSHLDMAPLNDDVEANMARMLVTLDTSHFDISPLNNDTE